MGVAGVWCRIGALLAQKFLNAGLPIIEDSLELIANDGVPHFAEGPQWKRVVD